MQKLTRLLSDPVFVLGGILAVSAAALAAAYTAQYAFGLAPCHLCLFQRMPFILTIILSIVGLIMKRNETAAMSMIAFSGLAFLANSALAVYHSGVERHQWQSALEGCAVHFEGDSQDLTEKILGTAAGRCDEIPWADPVFGLSMANYNAILCFGLFLMCLASVVKLRRKY